MAQMIFGEAVRCEAVRKVFEGRSLRWCWASEQWLALLIESRLLAGAAKPAHSEQLSSAGVREAPASSGSIDGRPFDWRTPITSGR
jgi:type VI secretion system protein ImpE